MKTLIIILFSAIFVNNFVLSKFLGICPFLGVSKKLSSAVGMSVAVTAVMVVSSAVTWPIYTYLLKPKYEYLQTLVFILVIASLVQIVEILLKKFVPPLYESLGIYLPLITTNCAVLGVALLNIQESYTFIESIVNALGAGLGFMLALVLFSGIREKLEKNDRIPKALRGLPIALIAASIVSVSFMGFSGVIEGIFR
ncbi:MAG: electron transport complex protein RnfA [Oscillospiraceae bacterium]|nr:electron transport complex protein RnfA [Oscillospiraceae bacterium]